MAMKKIAVAVLALVVLTGLVVVIALVDKHSPPPTTPPGTGEGSEPPSVAAETGHVKGEPVPSNESGISQEALKPLDSRIGSDGVMTIAPRNYTHGMAFVEMSFFKRYLDGKVKPYPLDDIQLSPLVGYGGNTGLRGAHGLRLGVTDAPNVRRALSPGEGYRITYYTPVDGPSTKPLTPYPSFSVPENLPPNSVYRVDLIIEDEIARQQFEAARQATAQRRQQIVEQETITVTFTESLDTRFAVLYWAGDHQRESTGAPGTRTVAIKGPNPLGGELAVCRIIGRLWCWAYISNVQSRSVTLPTDADVVVRDNKLVKLDIVFDEADTARLADFEAVGLYTSPDARLPVFAEALPRRAAPDQSIANVLSLKALPGTYYVRIGSPPSKDEIPIGTVSVTAKGPNRFDLQIPDR